MIFSGDILISYEDVIPDVNRKAPFYLQKTGLPPISEFDYHYITCGVYMCWDADPLEVVKNDLYNYLDEDNEIGEFRIRNRASDLIVIGLNQLDLSRDDFAINLIKNHDSYSILNDWEGEITIGFNERNDYTSLLGYSIHGDDNFFTVFKI